ncbi:30S ribosomal protein S13 [Candidatus Woesebacteria bacterium CG_4_10_14_0_2_um_filter_44_9]|uniref:Small ribosomal subunit protein uS13 n=1 Tax=Candidatus Woesebacteria bacterium CG_4_10_14_0_2_um_filter_44_9 TaxID=1975055 RepID=A0A2M7TIS9_9BACT|nr:MAG: 30S ribosomal protein S13 [Candidatus Woesebacteria bacterium CG_4_10_14_0_2_um_filter_44_9]
MARIAGVELADNWKVGFALTRIRGIGWPLSAKILDFLKIDRAKRIAQLSPEEVARIAAKLEDYETEGELVRKVKANVARLQVIGSFRGSRHTKGLPVRGQRTRTNARTKRGKRKTIGAFKKEVLSKFKTTQKEGEATK